MRKLAVLVLIVAAMVTACGPKAPNGSSVPATPTQNPPATTPAQPAPTPAKPPEPVKLTIAGAVARNTNNGEGVAKWAELIEQVSNGQLQVDAHFGDLGGDKEILSQVEAGALDGIFVITDSVAALDGRFGVFGLPFMFANHAQAYAVQDGKLGQELLQSDVLREHNLMGLAYSDLGFRNFATIVRPINTPADLAGLKMRVLQSKTAQDTMAALGATPVPMSANELYSALQQKTIDGLDMPVPYALSSKLYEVLQYYSVSQHTFTGIVYLWNSKSWARLSPDQQQLLTEATKQAAAWHRDYDRNLEESGLQELGEKGLQINELKDTSPFVQAVRKVYDDAASRVGADVIAEARREASAGG